MTHRHILTALAATCALATGAATVAVACPFCMIMLSDGIAAENPAVQVRDIAELLAERLPPT